jgi:hypothetical protein
VCNRTVYGRSVASGADAEAARGPGVELQFSGVRVGVESRPRAAAHALHVSLGAVCLRERLTPHTLFPVLVAPQVRTPPLPAIFFCSFI